MILKRFNKLSNGYSRKAVTIISILATINSLIEIGVLFLFSNTIRILIDQEQRIQLLGMEIPTVGHLVYLTILFVMLNVLVALFANYVQSYMSSQLNMKIVNQIHENIMKGINLSISDITLSSIVNASTQEATRISNQIFLPLIIALSKTATTIVLILYLLFINFWLLISSLVILSGLYFLIIFGTQNKMKDLSRGLTEVNEQRVRQISDVYGVHQEVYLGQHKLSFVEQFKKLGDLFSVKSAMIFTIKSTSKPIVEGVGIACAIITLYYLSISQSIVPDGKNLSEISIFIVAFLKILPSGQAVFTSIAGIHSTIGSLEKLEGLFETLTPRTVREKQLGSRPELLVVHELEMTLVQPNVKVGPITLNIFEGDCIIFYGESGLGKSTILKQMANLDNFHNNTSIFAISGVIIRTRPPVAYQIVPQFPELVSGSLAYNITFKNNLTEDEVERLLAILKRLNLEKLLHDCGGLHSTIDQPENLSGGQKKRIGIARAVYQNAELILMDEPMSGLDEATQVTVMEYLHELNNSGTAFIITSHHTLNFTGASVYKFRKNEDTHVAIINDR